MRVFEVKTTGFGRLLFLADSVEGAIDEFKAHVARVDKLNGYDSGPNDIIILHVRRIGLVINAKK